MEVTEKMLKEGGDSLFYAIINGEELTQTIKTHRGIFVIKYANQRELQKIDWIVARMRAGVPTECFDAVANLSLIKTATLDVLTVTGADWYEKAKVKNENFSWRDVPDTELIDELYVKAFTFREEVKNQIGRAKKEADSAKSEHEDVQKTLDDDVFSGVTGDTKTGQ